MTDSADEYIMQAARMYAGSCWCDPDTSHIILDPALANVVAKRIAAWIKTAKQFQSNVNFYRTLLMKCAAPFGDEAREAEGGSIQCEPVFIKLPELIEAANAELRRLTTPRLIAELRVDAGDVLLWWTASRPPEVGGLDDVRRHRVIYEDAPAYWTPIPKVKDPSGKTP